MQVSTLNKLNLNNEFTTGQVEQILEMQRSVLEYVALGHNYQETLDHLCRTA